VPTETGSKVTACATTQFLESLVTEPLREKPALARPVRQVIFGIWSLAGETRRNLGLVSGPKNSGPGAACLKPDIVWGQAKSLVLAGPFSGKSRTVATAMPRGRRPSTAACTSVGAIKARVIVRLTCLILYSRGCDLLNIRDRSGDQLIEPMSPAGVVEASGMAATWSPVHGELAWRVEPSRRCAVVRP
jgi:hypothetical protein